jgi:hypothetical protein
VLKVKDDFILCGLFEGKFEEEIDKSHIVGNPNNWKTHVNPERNTYCTLIIANGNKSSINHLSAIKAYATKSVQSPRTEGRWRIDLKFDPLNLIGQHAEEHTEEVNYTARRTAVPITLVINTWTCRIGILWPPEATT